MIGQDPTRPVLISCNHFQFGANVKFMYTAKLFKQVSITHLKRRTAGDSFLNLLPYLKIFNQNVSRYSCLVKKLYSVSDS